MLAALRPQDGSMSLQKQKRECFTPWKLSPKQAHSAGEPLACRLTVQGDTEQVKSLCGSQQTMKAQQMGRLLSLRDCTRD